MSQYSQSSVDFNGFNNYLVVGDHAPYQFERTDPFSVSAWVRTTVTFGFDAIVSKLDASAPNVGWEIGVDAGTREVVVQLINTFATNLLRITTNSASPAPNDGAWHHLVFTYDGSSTPGGLIIYIDGVSQSMTTIDNTLTASILTTTPLQIGARDGVAEPFFGNVDDVSIYDKELSGAEVTAIYNNGSPTDNRLLATVANLVGYWGMGDFSAFPTIKNLVANGGQSAQGHDFSRLDNDLGVSGVVSTDGSADNPGGISNRSFSPGAVGRRYIITDANLDDRIGNLQPGAPFSVSFWYKSNSTNAVAIVSKIDSALVRGWYISQTNNAGGGALNFILRDDLGGGERVNVNAGTNDHDNTWRHYVMVYDGVTPVAASTLTVWRNAVDVSTTGTDTFPATGTFLNTATDFQLSGHDGGNLTIEPNHYLAEVQFYNKALSSGEVTALYNAGAPTYAPIFTDSNLVGYWRPGEDFHDGAMTNMIAGNIDTLNFPAGLVCGGEVAFLGPFSSSKELGEFTLGTAWVLTAGDSSGAPQPVYKMRALQDPGPGYHVWTVTGAPDFLGSSAPGAIQAGTAVIADQWVQ